MTNKGREALELIDHPHEVIDMVNGREKPKIPSGNARASQFGAFVVLVFSATSFADVNHDGGYSRGPNLTD